MILRLTAFFALLCPTFLCAQAADPTSDAALIGQEASPFDEGDRYVALFRNGDTWQIVEYQNKAGDAVVGGDIILDSHANLQKRTAANAIWLLRAVNATVLEDDDLFEAIDEIEALFGDPTAEGAVERFRKPWPSRRVPYVLDGVDSRLHADIATAIGVWNAATNVEIVPANPGEREVLRFRDADGEGWSCSAQLGYRRGYGGQVKLNPPCGFGATLHEIGHALGIMHEHSRPDRDRFLRTEAFASGRNFDITPSGVSVRTDYDLCSLMHYSPRQTPGPNPWFSLTAIGEQMFQACARKLPTECRNVGQRCLPSRLDVALINALYP